MPKNLTSYFKIILFKHHFRYLRERRQQRMAFENVFLVQISNNGSSTKARRVVWASTAVGEEKKEKETRIPASFRKDPPSHLGSAYLTTASHETGGITAFCRKRRRPVPMSSGKLPGSGMCLIFKVKWDREQLFLLWEIHEF